MTFNQHIHSLTGLNFSSPITNKSYHNFIHNKTNKQRLDLAALHTTHPAPQVLQWVWVPLPALVASHN
jgi:hypothetical protein